MRIKGCCAKAQLDWVTKGKTKNFATSQIYNVRASVADGGKFLFAGF